MRSEANVNRETLRALIEQKLDHSTRQQAEAAIPRVRGVFSIMPAKVAAIALGLNAKLALPQQLRELDAPGLVGGEQLGRRSTSRLVHHRLCGRSERLARS